LSAFKQCKFQNGKFQNGKFQNGKFQNKKFQNECFKLFSAKLSPPILAGNNQLSSIRLQ
jgi:hypothetical protein